MANFLVSSFSESTSSLTLGQLEQVLAVLPPPLALIDGEGLFVFANEVWLARFGWSDSEPPPLLGDLFLAEKPACIQNPKGFLLDLVTLKASDGPFLAELTCVVWSGSPGIRILFLEERTDSERLKRQHLALEAKWNGLKQDHLQFLSAVSHDLNEPLEKLQAFGFLLREECGENLEPQVLDYLTLMSDASLRLRSRLDDLLVYSRIYSQGQPMIPVALQAIWTDVTHAKADIIRTSKAVIEVAPLPTLVADPFQMRLLLGHLLDNALKFRHEGQAPHLVIQVKTVSQLAEDPEVPGLMVARPMVEFRFRDKGIGFEPSMSEKIFQPFLRLVPKNAFPGNGMGLAICKAIVLRHEGLIGARSKFGEGSVFKLRLPINAGRSGADSINFADSC